MLHFSWHNPITCRRQDFLSHSAHLTGGDWDFTSVGSLPQPPCRESLFSVASWSLEDPRDFSSCMPKRPQGWYCELVLWCRLAPSTVSYSCSRAFWWLTLGNYSQRLASNKEHLQWYSWADILDLQMNLRFLELKSLMWGGPAFWIPFLSFSWRSSGFFSDNTL